MTPAAWKHLQMMERAKQQRIQAAKRRRNERMGRTFFDVLRQALIRPGPPSGEATEPELKKLN